MYLKIGGLKYELVYVKDLKDTKDNSKLNGQIQWDDCRVDIDDAISKQKQNQVIVHEALHGILDDYCLEDNENIVRRIGHGIYEFIVDNGTLIKEIIKYDKKLKKQTKD